MESHDREAERVIHLVDVTPEMKKSVMEGQVMFNIKDNKKAPETESVQNEHQPSVVSSADGAKVLKDLDIIIKEYDKNKRPNTFLGDLAKVLGAKQDGSNSQYATFEAMNGKVFTIRLSNHNAKVSTFDNHDESEGISIVITPQKNNGITNDGDAHVTEYYYDAIKLRRADSKPLVEILKSVKQSLYSGEYKDTTGLAEILEVNDIRFSIKEVNDRFNAELQQQIDGTLPKGHIYQLGIPGDILISAGIEDLPIELAASRL